MQFIYTQEEHDRIKTDKEEFERRVDDAVAAYLKEKRAGVSTVLNHFVKRFSVNEYYSPYRVQVSITDLRRLADDIAAAHGVLPKDVTNPPSA